MARLTAKQLPKDTNLRGNQNEDGVLTERQRSFVHHLVHNKLNQSAAARAAGFDQSGTAAVTMMRNPKIIKAIAVERAEYAKASGMTKQKVIDGFAEAIDIGRLKADPIAMIAGWREIGKMCGFYEPTKSEVKISVNGQVMLNRLNSMDDAALLKLVEEDPLALEGEFKVIEDD